MKYQCWFLVITLFVFSFKTQAKDTLFVYTKADCSVCNQTKQVLSARQISYFEKQVAVPSYASEMLTKLAKSGFKNSIYMPVIYLGNTLLHPAYATETGLQTLDINAVVDSILKINKQGEIVKLANTTTPTQHVVLGTDSDCEQQTGAMYLVVANYPSEKEAVNAVQILIKNGFYKSGFVHSGVSFRVYTDVFPDFKSASAQLAVEKFRFTDAYLLPVVH